MPSAAPRFWKTHFPGRWGRMLIHPEEINSPSTTYKGSKCATCITLAAVNRAHFRSSSDA